jgi:GcrA cell cycle regulator
MMGLTTMHQATEMQWDHEKQHFVQELWPTHSASAISEEVGSRFREPCNRNMVMGIVHRLQKNGLEKKGAGTLPKVNTRSTRAPPREKKVRTMPTPPPAPSFKPKNYPAWDALNTAPCLIVELDDSRCHWPLGNVNEVATLFCGAVAADGWPYCAHHTRMAYVPDRRAAA